MVLLGVEDLEQGSRGVTPEVGGHLVDLVEEEDGIDLPSGLHPLNDATRQGADVGASVPPDLRLISNPAEAHADELAV